MSFDVPATPVEIVKVGHSALRNGTQSVPQLFGTPALHELIEVMRVTLAGNGVGLAAPQIAVPLRLFVVEDNQERMDHLTPEQQKARNLYPFPFEPVINPIWYATSPEMVIETEGCLSIPGFKADVCRYWAIEVEGFQPNGQRKTWSLKGWPLRIFQHEIDDLDGRLLTDCMLPRTLTSTEPHGTGASSDLLERLAISMQLPTEFGAGPHMCLGLDLARLAMRAVFTAHIEAEERALQRPARLQQIDCHRRISGAVCSRGKLKSHATGPAMLTCALGVTCDECFRAFDYDASTLRDLDFTVRC